MGRWWFFGILATVLLLAGACGQPPIPEDDQGGGQTQINTTDTGAASSIDEAKDATIYIEAAGGLFDVGRQFGEMSYGSGSGFIVDDSGIAVTNNHVVTGSSYLNVYVEGDEEPYRAEILGASECSDLALIDIEEGGYPFVEWRDGPIESALDVTAIGYPAEDVTAGEKPDQTVTSGIINTTDASGEVPWASVESVIEHEATIRPGNSGGPLLDSDGKVVGINFAGDDTERYLAVSRDETQDLIMDLRSRDVASIGVNGETYSDSEVGYSGILVISVKTGSPAFNTGVQGVEVSDDTGEPTQFDVITEIEGTRLGEDETMKTYCDVLRAHDTQDPLTIEVERYDFDESGNLADFSVLDGVLNGDELKENDDKTEERLEQLVGGTEQTTGGESEAGFTEVTDETGAITVEVPVEWSEIDGSPDEVEGIGNVPDITVSTDLDKFYETYEVPGVKVQASSAFPQRYTPDTLLDDYDQSESCERDGAREDYDDGVYVGRIDIWTNCGGVPSQELLAVAASPEDQSFMVLVLIQVTGAADVDAASRILDTFQVVGEV